MPGEPQSSLSCHGPQVAINVSGSLDVFNRGAEISSFSSDAILLFLSQVSPMPTDYPSTSRPHPALSMEDNADTVESLALSVLCTLSRSLDSRSLLGVGYVLSAQRGLDAHQPVSGNQRSCSNTVIALVWAHSRCLFTGSHQLA